jgi:hypothetical protein
MSIKISANLSAVAHHIIAGAFTFPYSVDAHSAVARHPGEWSFEPWSHDAVAKAREANGEVLEPLSAEEQAALDEHAKAVADANARLNAFREKRAAAKAEEDQAAADEALVHSAPPQPARRPFGRKGEPTPAELRMIKDKKHEDDLAAAERGGAKLTG